MKDTEIKIESLDEIDLSQAKSLGSGYISDVKMGVHKPSGQKVAVKIVR